LGTDKSAANKSGQKKNLVVAVLGRLGKPLIWGMSAWGGFYLLLFSVSPSDSLLLRYLASHPVEYIETAMFFVGLAALVIKAIDTAKQHAWSSRFQLAAASQHDADDLSETSTDLISTLAAVPASMQGSYLVRRLRAAFDFVQRQGTADGLDEELKYLSESDDDRQHGDFAFVRLIIWAVPILGFLGTVIGITLAMSNLSATELEQSMNGLTSAMGVAFDTTALALTLSIVLMFSQFLTEAMGAELLKIVDERVAHIMAEHFPQDGAGADPQLNSIRRMSEQVVRSTENLVMRQAEIWQGSLDVANERWTNLVDKAGGRVEDSLSEALGSAVEAHQQKIAEAESVASERNDDQLSKLMGVIESNAAQIQVQQEAMKHQGETMLKVLEATGQVASLQQSLNDNLKTLAHVGNFEETVMSLSAAIHLLNTRVGQAGTAHDVNEVELSNDPQGRAA